MANTIEFIMKAIDKITPTMNQVKQQTENMTTFMQDNWLKVGAATGAAATAIEGFAKKQAPLLEGARKLANSLDMDEGAMIDLITQTSNVTFSLDDVIGVMEKGRQQGIKSAEDLQNYANFWDLLADATGESSVAMADQSSALRAVGVAAGDEAEAISALGYIHQETTGNINEFLQTVGRMGPDLRELGLDVDDTAALLGAMEHELGMTSRVAKTEFSQAVNQSEGDLGKLLEILGLTGEQFDTYKGKVKASSTVLEEHAKINNETMFTALDKIKHQIGEVAMKFSPFITQLADFAPALMLVGPAMKIVATVSSGLGEAVGLISSGFTTALTGAKSFIALAMANPLTPWIIAIGAVVAAIVLIYKNWDKIVEFFKATIDVIKDVFSKIATWVSDTFGGVWEKVQEIFGLIFDYIVDKFSNLASFIVNPFGFIIEQLDNLFPGLKDSLVGFLESIGDFMSEKMGWIVEKVLGVWEGFTDKLKSVWSGVGEALKGFVNIFINALNWLIDRLNKFSIKIPDWVPKALGGGKTWGFNIPKIPTLHDGGVYRAPTPGGEGLALLRDKETVRTPEQEKALQSGASIVISQGAIVINTQRLDDREINRVGDKLMDVIISKSRAYNLRFGR